MHERKYFRSTREKLNISWIFFHYYVSHKALNWTELKSNEKNILILTGSKVSHFPVLLIRLLSWIRTDFPLLKRKPWQCDLYFGDHQIINFSFWMKKENDLMAWIKSIITFEPQRPFNTNYKYCLWLFISINCICGWKMNEWRKIERKRKKQRRNKIAYEEWLKCATTLRIGLSICVCLYVCMCGSGNANSFGESCPHSYA